MSDKRIYTAHLNIKLPPKMLADLKKLAKNRGMTFSEMVRQQFRKLLDEAKEKDKKAD